MENKNVKIHNENTGPGLTGSFKSNLMSVLSPVLFVIFVTVLMIVLVKFRGS